MQDMDEFINIYEKTFSKITDDYVKYINEIINIDASVEVYLTIDILEEIQTIVKTIAALKKSGIRTDNYNEKVKKYIQFCKTALSEYGLFLETDIPFANPVLLYLWIDAILMDAGLTDIQRSDFYKETKIRTRIPNKEKVLQELSHFDINLDDSSKGTVREKISSASKVYYDLNNDKYYQDSLDQDKGVQEARIMLKNISLMYPLEIVPGEVMKDIDIDINLDDILD